MKLLTLKGREVRINLRPSSYPIKSRAASRSHGQFHLGQQLQKIYPIGCILEEFSLPDSRLSLDFFVPSRTMAFEFQGEQHDRFNAFFHATQADFVQQKARDVEKRQWCDMNDITLVEVRNPKISEEALKAMIVESLSE